MDHPILIVGTSVDAVRPLTTALAALGRRVNVANNVPAAIEMAERTPPALGVIALGAEFPARGELIAFLGRPSQFTPVILVTTPDDYAAQLAGFSGLVEEVLVQPFATATLTARAQLLLRVHARVLELTRHNCELVRTVDQCREHTEYALQSLRDSAAVLEYNLRFARDVADADPDEARAALLDATEAANRIVRRLESVAALSLNLTALEPAIRRFSPREVMLQIARWARREAQTRSIRLGWSVAAGLRVEADPDLYRRVLENLVDNALRHTQAGGRIEVTVEAGSASVRAAVSDTGTLVPKAQRARMFEHDSRGVARARDGSGPGFGLYFCRRIVEAHRGTLGIEDRQGWSNTFVVDLPRRLRGIVRGPTAPAGAPNERIRSR